MSSIGLVALGNIWPEHMSFPLVLALMGALGYLVGRYRRTVFSESVYQSRRELRRAQIVAAELENISLLVRKQLTKHHASLARFKQRVDKLGSKEHEAAWKELCQEAEEILKPTLQLANQIANAYDEIRQQSNHLMTFTDVRTDPLTGVANRRALDETLVSQFAMKARYGTSFTMALFDLDHFKEINDKRGHLQGDRMLQEVAHLLDEGARETDTVARYGGEEFAVIMPETDLHGACIFSERMRADVAAKMPLSISGGVTVALDGDTPESLLGRADAALYAAKSAGRNCVFCHDGAEVEAIVGPPPTVATSSGEGLS
ncbi:MAG: GGDEF domain-containing protein [Pirellulales bacterium]|nr:GGDEF domain-containing protein [Pirellulales bacterium]